MLTALVERIIDYMIAHAVIPEEERESYAYSLEVVLGSCSFWLIMLCLVIAFDQILPTVFYLGWFFLFRSVTGGYHAHTHFRCITLSVLFYLGFIGLYTQLSSKAYFPLTLLLIGVTVLLVLLFAPVDHSNKPFSLSEKQLYRRRSCQRLICFILFEAVVIFLGWTSLAFSAALGAAQSAVFLLIAYYVRKEERNYEGILS
mgnify:CR=1 FL=1